MKKLEIVIWGGVIIFIIFLLVLTIYSFATIKYSTIEESFDVYSTNAPNGIYWRHTYGAGGILFRWHNSNMIESYVIKFMDGDILETIILKSTDNRLNVHFTDDNSSMTIKIKITDTFKASNLDDWKEYIGNQHCFDWEFDLYIPKPELCEIPSGIVID